MNKAFALIAALSAAFLAVGAHAQQQQRPSPKVSGEMKDEDNHRPVGGSAYHPQHVEFSMSYFRHSKRIWRRHYNARPT
ncbi:hypothetical protein ABID59_001419 [Bradyrhizobium sp. S3.3.6]|uniref:hypothetical protein n=1 Tax=Bradyrhizobium sp. S3.3.6 TaxID=3156429 RepID=UPI00339905F6